MLYCLNCQTHPPAVAWSKEVKEEAAAHRKAAQARRKRLEAEQVQQQAAQAASGGVSGGSSSGTPGAPTPAAGGSGLQTNTWDVPVLLGTPLPAAASRADFIISGSITPSSATGNAFAAGATAAAAAAEAEVIAAEQEEAEAAAQVAALQTQLAAAQQREASAKAAAVAARSCQQDLALAQAAAEAAAAAATAEAAEAAEAAVAAAAHAEAQTDGVQAAAEQHQQGHEEEERHAYEMAVRELFDDDEEGEEVGQAEAGVADSASAPEPQGVAPRRSKSRAAGPAPQHPPEHRAERALQQLLVQPPGAERSPFMPSPLPGGYTCGVPLPAGKTATLPSLLVARMQQSWAELALHVLLCWLAAHLCGSSAWLLACMTLHTAFLGHEPPCRQDPWRDGGSAGGVGGT